MVVSYHNFTDCQPQLLEKLKSLWSNINPAQIIDIVQFDIFPVDGQFEPFIVCGRETIAR